MKYLLTLFLLIVSLGLLSATLAEKIVINDDIQLYKLQDSIYVHVTWDSIPSMGKFSSNGMIIVQNGEALMIDTPMDNEKTKILVSYLRDKMHIKVSKLIAGHYHDDCIGGLRYLKSIGVSSVANDRTRMICKKLRLPVPDKGFNKELDFFFHGKPIACRYWGGGHTVDNITVWLPKEKILFGGCLVKSSASTTLGNIADAKVADWDKTVAKVLQAYPNARFVVPGHGEVGGTELLSHTIDLVQGYKAKN